MPKKRKKLATLALLNLRERNRVIGSIGARVRSSHHTNAASSAAPAVNEPMTVPDPHPRPFARTRPKTTPNRPALAKTSPGASSRCAVPRLSPRRSLARGRSARPIGTSTMSIRRRPKRSPRVAPVSSNTATASV